MFDLNNELLHKGDTRILLANLIWNRISSLNLSILVLYFLYLCSEAGKTQMLQEVALL